MDKRNLSPLIIAQVLGIAESKFPPVSMVPRFRGGDAHPVMPYHVQSSEAYG